MNKKLRLLIVEDSEDDAQLLVLELGRSGYELVWERVESEEAMRNALETRQWDLVISDFVLPSFSGMAALQVLRDTRPDLPFIIVSGKIGENIAVDAMKAGANDYLIKGHTERLLPAIERELHEAEVRRQKRHAELALVKSEQRYRRMVAAVTDYIYTVKIEGNKAVKTSHGPACFAVTGYTPEEFDARHELWYEMIFEEDREEVMARTCELMAGHEIPTFEHRIRHKNGSIHWVRNTIVPRFSEAGELVAYDGLIVDITEQKKAEEALRLQSAALNAAANAIVITNSSGVIRWVNPAFTGLTGFSWDEAVGNTLRLLKSGLQGDEFYKGLWQTILAGEVWVGEVINRRRNGTLYTEEQTITPVLDQRGDISSFVVIKQDVTERKNADKALLQNARMLRELEIAEQIQLSLLPSKAPELGGIQLAGRCAPAAHVGGDYYDYFPLGPDAVDLVIADVSGHSVGSALLMTEVRSVLRAQVTQFYASNMFLAALNHLMYEDLTRAEHFISMFYARYDNRSRLLCYSSAGHVPPLLVRQNDAVPLELDAEGMVMGVQQDVSFEEKQVELMPGDVVLFYTDGIIEAQNADGNFFGKERLTELIVRNDRESAAEIVDDLMSAVQSFVWPTPLQDDISLVILKVD